MAQIKDFVLSLVSASAATLILESIIPDGGLKKYLKYLLALFILVVLLSPFKEILPGVMDLSGIKAYSYDIGKTSDFANGIVASHIKAAISEKFSLSERYISITVNDGTAVIKMKSTLGVLAEDVTYYTATLFGIPAEVIFY